MSEQLSSDASTTFQRLPCYTEAELRSPDGPHLPGLWEPFTIDPNDPFAFFRDNNWIPVLNLTVVTEFVNADGRTDFAVWGGVRKQETHTDVASSPTQVIRDPMLVKGILRDAFDRTAIQNGRSEDPGAAYVAPLHLNDFNVTKGAVIAEFLPHPVELSRDFDPLARAARMLLADKLGFGAWYEPDNAKRLAEKGLRPSLGSISLSRMVAGLSGVDDHPSTGEPRVEPVVMLNGVLRIRYPNLFPRETGFYHSISLNPYQNFVEGVEQRSVENIVTLNTEAEAVQFCARGHCLLTSREALIGEDLAGHAGSELRRDATRQPGVRWDDHHTSTIIWHLEHLDQEGEDLRRRTADILGFDGFAGERVVGPPRSLKQESNDHKVDTRRTWWEVDDASANQFIARIYTSLGVAVPFELQDQLRTN